MEKLKVILIGAGNRGTTYARLGGKNCPEVELVGVADPDPIRRNYLRDLFSLDESVCFNSWEDILALPKMADAAIIATQDQLHFEPAMKAISLGYHLLLEKPAAPTPEECLAIAQAANQKGVEVIVCHVLRFTPFFTTLKRLIEEGRVGRVINMIHTEAVGNIHQSHSYVRGNWRNTKESTPMILAKSCHDIDILQWLLGKRCTRLQSFGSLSYFCKENKPDGAPEYCVQGCPAEDTGYDVRRGKVFYGESDLVGFKGVHIECKAVERLNIREALRQAIEEAQKRQDGIPVVFSHKNRDGWIVAMRLEDFMDFYGAWEANDERMGIHT